MSKPRTIADRASINRKIHGLTDHATASAMACARFGVESMSELTDREMHDLYMDLIEKAPSRPGSRPEGRSHKPKKRGPRRGPMGEISRAQIDYIIDLRPQVAGMTNDETFRMWVARKFHFVVNPDKLDMLTNGQGQKIIGGLNAMAKRSGP